MEFMCKMQNGNIIQVNDFSVSENKLQIKCYDKQGDIGCCWSNQYQTEERRDEVMGKLEKWIREMIILKSITLSPINLFEKFDEIASEVIFTFPKE